jgi:hypothetical protein
MLHRHDLPPPKPRLLIYPGERTNAKGTVVGHIYVFVGDKVTSYDMAGGPPPNKGYKDGGGHWAGVTPAGHYILDHAEHHTTRIGRNRSFPGVRRSGTTAELSNIKFEVYGSRRPAHAAT